MGKQTDKSDLPGYKFYFDHPLGGMRLDDPNCEEPNGSEASVENNSTSRLANISESMLLLPLRKTMPPVPLEAVRSETRPRAAVVVAHPDDETLWCGGYILTHPEFRWRVVTLCRASDPDRAPKFRQVLQQLGAEGEMADLDDEPDQVPLPIEQVRETIALLLAGGSYSLVLTHGPKGEYTRHRRHEECCQSVLELWRSGGIDTGRLWLFAYEDGGRAYLPRVRDDADRRYMLTDDIWREKHRLISDCYGYGADSWEAQSTPREEGFWCFDSAQTAVKRAALLEEKT
jgi:LmbE family N-acetylglucosaminyl deacetylase